MYDDGTTETDATQTPAPAKKAKTGTNKNKTQAVTTKTTTKTTTTSTNKAQQAVNKTQNDITNGTPRVSSFFQSTTSTDATNKTAHDKDVMIDEEVATPAAAFNALTHTTTPIPKQGKRGRIEPEEEKEDDDDDAPLIPTVTTRAPFTLGAKETRKKNKEKINE
jgi:hypothetical protein